MLVSDVPEGAHHLESSRLVQTDRRRLRRIADDRHHLTVSAVGAGINQGAQQRHADSAAMRRALDVHGILHRVSIGGTRAVGTGVGVPAQPVVELGNDSGIVPLQEGCPAPAHFDLVRRRCLEARGAGLDVMGVDGGDGRHVGIA